MKSDRIYGEPPLAVILRVHGQAVKFKNEILHRICSSYGLPSPPAIPPEVADPDLSGGTARAGGAADADPIGGG